MERIKLVWSSPSISEIIEWRSGIKILTVWSFEWLLARRTIGSKAPRQLPKVNSLFTRKPVKIVFCIVSSKVMVECRRFELLTSSLPAKRSSQMS